MALFAGAYKISPMSAPLPQPALDWRSAARLIDHTLLLPQASREQILQLCREAELYGVAAVCVPPVSAALAVFQLRSTPVRVGSVVGFPQGNTLATVKRFEAAELLRIGVDELDMVINIGSVKSSDYSLVESELNEVIKLSHEAGAIVKVILETSLLTHEEIIASCNLALSAGADFVKTSTGFGPGQATVEDVRLLRSTVGARAGVKAAGGIRTAEQFQAMLEAGADRIGASASVNILRELGAP